MGYPMIGAADDTFSVWYGWVCTVSTLYLFLSPALTMRRIVKEQSTSEFSDKPYVTAWINCVLWVGYAGITPGRAAPLITNISGVTLETIYLAVFGVFLPKAVRVQFALRMALALFICVVAIAGAVLIEDEDTRQAATTALGIAADVFNGLMYGAPLLVMGKVIKTKSVEFMPLNLSVATTLVSTLWSFYAIWVGDIYIGLPNHAGVLLGIAQLVLYWMYYGSTPQQDLLLRPATPEGARTEGLPIAEGSAQNA